MRLLIRRSPPCEQRARRVKPDRGWLRERFSLRAPLPVQELIGPRTIKASGTAVWCPTGEGCECLLIPRLSTAIAVLLASGALAACGSDDEAGNPDSELS